MYLFLWMLSQDALSRQDSRMTSCSFCIDLGMISLMFWPVMNYFLYPKTSVTFFETFRMMPIFSFYICDSKMTADFSNITARMLKFCFFSTLKC